MITRRSFLRNYFFLAGACLLNPVSNAKAKNANKIKISLAEWSLHRTLNSGQLDHLDFPAKAMNTFGINAVEYVNGFFGGKKMNFKEAGKNTAYLTELLQRSKDAGVVNHLIMIDEEGPLSVPKDKVRLAAVEDHKKWIDAAKFLGCKTVRLNLHGDGSANDKKVASIDSLSRLGLYAKPMDINVVVENHGNESSDAAWVADIMRQVNMQNVGTLPDFGNFCLTHPWGTTDEDCSKAYDRYQGVKELLPFAKGVSAKTYDFDNNGEQTKMDYRKLIDIVKASGFEGYIGIEFEGKTQDEEDGIRSTKALIEKYL
jgi:sugar phosphate isomerase/epimerase